MVKQSFFSVSQDNNETFVKNHHIAYLFKDKFLKILWYLVSDSARSRPGDRGGPGHPDLREGVGNGLQKSFFQPFRPHQFGLKIRGGLGPPEAPPLDTPLSDI